LSVSIRDFSTTPKADERLAFGIEAVARAYLKVIDTASKMEISELKASRATGEPSK
jgi:hypothetical protein